MTDEKTGLSYDQIMGEISKLDLSNGVPYDYVFSKKKFDSNNSVNQLDLDKALGIKSTPKNTQSCQTTALLNAYANNVEGGITGKDILDVLKKKDESFNDNLDFDGSLKNINGLSKDLAKKLGLTKMIKADDNKTKPTKIITSIVGVIVGLTKDGKRDQHFVYKNTEHTVDSLSPDRPSAKKYTENSYRKLSWQGYE